jgi:hypothetical protein
MVAKVVTGIPKAPKATGVVSKIKVYTNASAGSNLYSRKESLSSLYLWTDGLFYIITPMIPSRKSK